MFEHMESMKSILLVSGSASTDSSNAQLLRLMASTFGHLYHMEVVDGLWELPLYAPQREEAGIPAHVRSFREQVGRAEAVVISTPEYLHNIPAVLKNALEWLTTSGELAGKPVLPITLTPRAPRGEHAMRSLIPSLRASNALVVAELHLHLDRLRKGDESLVLDDEHRMLLHEALSLL